MRLCPVSADTARHTAQLTREEARDLHRERCRTEVENEPGAPLRALFDALAAANVDEDGALVIAYRTGDAAEFGRRLFALINKQLDRDADALAAKEPEADYSDESD